MNIYFFPGQGSQFIGMGEALFDEFPDMTEKAENILGYSLKNICLSNLNNNLNDTQFTQPVLYVVNAMYYQHLIKKTNQRPDFLIGNSLGEYNALYAAGVMSFEDGLRLVKVRGKLMSEVNGGSMAAIIGLTAEKIDDILSRKKVSDTVQISNRNTRLQNVISGLPESIDKIIPVLLDEGAKKSVKLQVSGAFHSVYMKPAAKEFAKELEKIDLMEPACTVISNRYGKPYELHNMKQTLLEQMSHPVLLEQSIRYALIHGAEEFFESGPGKTMTNMVTAIKSEMESEIETAEQADKITKVNGLGSLSFKKEYHTELAYAVGGIRDGISSGPMLKKLADSNILGYLGTKGLDIHETNRLLEDALNMVGLEKIGVHVSCDVLKPEYSNQQLKLMIDKDIRRLQLSGYQRPDEWIYEYRIRNIRYSEKHKVVSPYKLLVCVNNLKAAEEFLKPIDKDYIKKMIELNKLTQIEAEMVAALPVCDDICIDNTGIGAGGFGWISSIKKLIDRICTPHSLKKRVRVGICGGIGNPQMLAMAFFAGADFVMTGTINQCTVEAETSTHVKDLLQAAKENDFAFVPADDLFEFGEKMSVLKRGTLYPTRAQKVYDIYSKYASVDEISETDTKLLTEKYFGIGLQEMYQRIMGIVSETERILISEQSKYKLGLIMKGYLQACFHQAQAGEKATEINYGIAVECDMADINRWLQGTDIEHWNRRSIDIIAKRIMEEGEEYLKDTCQQYV